MKRIINHHTSHLTCADSSTETMNTPFFFAHFQKMLVLYNLVCIVLMIIKKKTETSFQFFLLVLYLGLSAKLIMMFISTLLVWKLVYFFLELKKVGILGAASVERFFVSRMQDSSLWLSFRYRVEVWCTEGMFLMF